MHILCHDLNAQSSSAVSGGCKSQLLLETLQHYRREGRYKLHAFVVMPDHVHLILTPLEITLERAVGMIKGDFSRRLSSKFPVWQRGFTDHRIRDAADMEARRNYLLTNPAKAGLVAAAELYRWSSAYRGSANGDELKGHG